MTAQTVPASWLAWRSVPPQHSTWNRRGSTRATASCRQWMRPEWRCKYRRGVWCRPGHHATGSDRRGYRGSRRVGRRGRAAPCRWSLLSARLLNKVTSPDYVRKLSSSHVVDGAPSTRKVNVRSKTIRSVDSTSALTGPHQAHRTTTIWRRSTNSPPSIARSMGCTAQPVMAAATQVWVGLPWLSSAPSVARSRITVCSAKPAGRDIRQPRTADKGPAWTWPGLGWRT